MMNHRWLLGLLLGTLFLLCKKTVLFENHDLHQLMLLYYLNPQEYDDPGLPLLFFSNKFTTTTTMLITTDFRLAFSAPPSFNCFVTPAGTVNDRM
jgi:hypothetical protein